MTILGRFTEQDDGGYAGVLRTLTLETPLVLAPARSDNPRAPSHRVLAGGVECGAAWLAEDEAGLLNVQMDDPAWPSPLRARLVRGRDEEGVILVWRRSPD